MTLKKYLEKAKKQKWAVGQFNFSTLSQLKAIIAVALETKSPLILGTSESEARFIGLERAVCLVKTSQNKGAPVFLHLDHGHELDFIKKAIAAGYDSIHFDGSEIPFKDNLKITKKVVEWAKKKRIIVEGELGIIPGASEIGESQAIKGVLTDVLEAREFVQETGIDSLAFSIGNIHGICPKMPELNFSLLKDIRERINCFLVLHGGSGISFGDLKKTIVFGVQKININTALRKSWREGLELSLSQNKKTVKPYEILAPVQENLEKIVRNYINIFNSQGKI